MAAHARLTVAMALLNLNSCAAERPKTPRASPSQPAATATPVATSSALEAAAATPVSARLLHAGVLRVEDENTASAPKTGLGWVHVTDPRAEPAFVSEGTTISADVGTHFGIQVIIEGPPKMTIVPLRTRVTHPPITNPETGTTTGVDEWESPMNAGIPRFAAWVFDGPSELVGGRWLFELLDEQRVILRQEFTVVVAR